jgi:hypothetical protein
LASQQLALLEHHHHNHPQLQSCTDLKHEPLGQLPASLQSVMLACVFKQHKRGRRGRSKEPPSRTVSAVVQEGCTVQCAAGSQADVLEPRRVSQNELPSCVQRLAAQLAALLPFQLESCSLQAAPLTSSGRRGR